MFLKQKDFNQYLGILNGAIAALTGPQDGVKSAVDVAAVAGLL